MTQASALVTAPLVVFSCACVTVHELPPSALRDLDGFRAREFAETGADRVRLLHTTDGAAVVFDERARLALHREADAEPACSASSRRTTCEGEGRQRARELRSYVEIAVRDDTFYGVPEARKHAEPVAIPLEEIESVEVEVHARNDYTRVGPARHAVFVDMAGTALGAGISYDYRFVQQASVRLGLGVGPLIHGGVGPADSDPTLSASVQALLGEGSHNFELGFGATGMWIGREEHMSVYLIPAIGYRYQPTGGGFLFRAVATPLVETAGKTEVWPWGGLSFGYTW